MAPAEDSGFLWKFLSFSKYPRLRRRMNLLGVQPIMIQWASFMGLTNLTYPTYLEDSILEQTLDPRSHFYKQYFVPPFNSFGISQSSTLLRAQRPRWHIV